MRSHKRIGTLPAGLPGIALAIVAGSTSSLHAGGAGFQGLGDLPGGLVAINDPRICPDGSVVVGYGSTLVGVHAFIWDANNGMRDLLAAWGGCADPCPPSCPADLDGDCNVGITDFLILLANWS